MTPKTALPRTLKIQSYLPFGGCWIQVENKFLVVKVSLANIESKDGRV